jgi:uncharacterized radical SAM superfamily Fe-S cluster-containing enzyme
VPLLDIKLQAVKRIGETGMRVILVPTLIRGVNDDQIGKILEFAIQNLNVVHGVSFQPVTFTGRIDRSEIAKRRMTLSDIAIGVQEQTGYADALADWFPLSALAPFMRLAGALSGREVTTVTCHPHCALCTYLYVDIKTGEAVPVTRFLDLKGLLREVGRLSEKAGKARYNLLSEVLLWERLRRFFRPGKAPSGLSFKRFLRTLDRYSGKHVGHGPSAREQIYPSLFVAGMHFMDSHNYDLARLKRCCVHYAAPDGGTYPFCSFNAGPIYRNIVRV